jgi:hypothetical protein
MEHHSRAEPALRVADVVEMRVDQREFTGVLLRGCGETEEREGRNAWTTGTRENWAGFEGGVGEPKRVSFKKSECGAVRGMSVAIVGVRVVGWAVMKGVEGRPLVDGRLEEWLAHCL